jgi:hypothetical protein
MENIFHNTLSHFLPFPVESLLLQIRPTQVTLAATWKVWSPLFWYFWYIHTSCFFLPQYLYSWLVLLQLSWLFRGCKLLYLLTSAIFWDITPCSPLKTNRYFGGTSRFDLQVRRKNQARNQHEAGNKQSSLHRSLFNPEEGGDMFFWSVRWLPTG